MINQPTNTVGTLEGLVSELTLRKESLEKTCTTLTSNVETLRTTITSEKYTIGEIEKQKSDLEQQIKNLDVSLALKQKEYDLVLTNTDEAKNELAKIRGEAVMIVTEQKIENDRLSQMNYELTKKEAEVTKTIDDYAGRAIVIARKETKLEAKAKALQDAIKSCLTPD